MDGVILPRGTFGDNGEMRPAGNTTFEVTFTFQEHADNNRGLGMDTGNARCDALVRAMADGRVVQRDSDPGNGALIVRIKHGDTGFSSGYAHMSSFRSGSARTSDAAIPSALSARQAQTPATSISTSRRATTSSTRGRGWNRIRRRIWR